MGFGRFSDSVIQGWLSELNIQLYGALFSANPFTSDPATIEIVGAGYTRPLVPVVNTTYNLLTSSGLIVWHGLAPGVHIAAVGLYDSSVGGIFKGAALLDTPVDLLSGGLFELSDGELVLGLDVATGP